MGNDLQFPFSTELMTSVLVFFGRKKSRFDNITSDDTIKKSNFSDWFINSAKLENILVSISALSSMKSRNAIDSSTEIPILAILCIMVAISCLEFCLSVLYPSLK